MRGFSRRETLRLLGAGAVATGIGATRSTAQTESVAWTRALSDRGATRLAGVAPDEDGGHVVAGGRGNAGYVASIGRQGGRGWEAVVSDTGSIEFSAVATRGGRQACVGTLEDDIQQDGFLALVEDGTVVQDHRFGAQQYNDTLHGVAALDDGFALVGETLDPDSRTAMGWAVRTGIAGLEQWSTSFGDGAGDGVFLDVTPLDSGFAFTGYKGDAAWVVETDEEGEVRQSRTFGGAGDAQRCTSILRAGAGYYLAGYAGAGEDQRGWIMLVDDALQQEWRRSFGDAVPARIDDMAAAGGPPYVAGAFGGVGLAIRASRSGAAWRQTFESVDGFTGTAAAADGAVFVGTRSIAGGSEGVVAKVETSQPATTEAETSDATATPDVELPDSGGDATATEIEDAGTTVDRTAADDPNGGAPQDQEPAESESPFGVPGFGIPAALVGAWAAGWAALRRGDDET